MPTCIKSCALVGLLILLAQGTKADQTHVYPQVSADRVYEAMLRWAERSGVTVTDRDEKIRTIAYNVFVRGLVNVPDMSVRAWTEPDESSSGSKLTVRLVSSSAWLNATEAPLDIIDGVNESLGLPPETIFRQGEGEQFSKTFAVSEKELYEALMTALIAPKARYSDYYLVKKSDPAAKTVSFELWRPKPVWGDSPTGAEFFMKVEAENSEAGSMLRVNIVRGVTALRSAERESKVFFKQIDNVVKKRS